MNMQIGNIHQMLAGKAGVGCIDDVVLSSLQIHDRHTNIFPERKHFFQLLPVIIFFCIRRTQGSWNEPSNGRTFNNGSEPEISFFSRSERWSGKYEGINQLDRASGYHLVTPDRITLFWRPIVEEVGPGDREALRREVRKTVIHEVAHHFGIDDAELERLGG